MLKRLLICVAVLLTGCAASPVTVSEETAFPGQMPAGKVKVETVTVRSKSPDIPFMFSFDLPSGWTYKVTEDNAENKVLAVEVYPEDRGEDSGAIGIQYVEFFGVCGTGLEQKKITFNGIPAHQGFYDGRQEWDFIALDGDYAGCVILRLGEWPGEYEPFVNTVLYSLQFIPAS